MKIYSVFAKKAINMAKQKRGLKTLFCMFGRVQIMNIEPKMRLELTTYALRERCSTN